MTLLDFLFVFQHNEITLFLIPTPRLAKGSGRLSDGISKKNTKVRKIWIIYPKENITNWFLFKRQTEW